MAISEKRHPKALPFLFLTEMWERFGFYVVQGMLVLYMSQSMGFSDDKSYTIFGTFSALAYIAPMVGGLLADRLLGYKMAIGWGGILLSIGYAMISLPWSNGFYLALGTIIVSNGLFKPNISSLLGSLYKPGDSLRDSGFTLFYIGINLGVLLAGLSSGILKNHFGWHVSFALASIGLLIGLSTFIAGIKWGDMKYESHLTQIKNRWVTKPLLIFYCLISIILISFLLQSMTLAKWLLPFVGIFLLFFIFYLAYTQDEIYKKRLMILNVLVISAIIFWMIYLQMFFSATLFIDRLIDKQVFNITIPTTAFYTLESLFIILLGPLFAWSWQSLNQTNRNPSPLIKFIVGIIFAGLGCLVLSMSTYFYNINNLVSPLWIVFSYLFITIGELLLSPIGLSAVTLLSPPRLTGMMMGIWFVSLGFGGQFAGLLAKLSNVPESLSSDPQAQLLIYRHAFFDYAILAFVVASFLFVLQRFLRRILVNDVGSY